MESIEEILKWIQDLNNEIAINIKKIKLSECTNWFFDKKSGLIRNHTNSFFQISGIKGIVNEKKIEQPIILQKEIGFLGIISKEIDGEVYYLMQAKIEPGNVNCVQISPTIQATKSNFMQRHGGNKPLYLDYFINANQYEIICDQIQSEQSARFYGKRNRNIILKIPKKENISIHKNFKWMTLEQIKILMKYDNLVNMDTRTVFSCLPLCSINFNGYCKKMIEKNISFYRSLKYENYIQEIIEIYHDINNYKMFKEIDREIIRLDVLEDWSFTDSEIICKHKFPYKIIFCDIEIEHREVKKWSQPLFEAIGIATFGLILTEINGVMKFLVKKCPEIGCFDDVEIGPTIQKEANTKYKNNKIEALFEKKLKNNEDIIFNTVLSEEGGRFYHEENRNIIMKVKCDEIKELPEGYHLVSFATLNHLNLINNCLNIQLRNLLSVLDII